MTYEPEPTAFHILWPLMSIEERFEFVRRAFDEAELGETVYVTDEPFEGVHKWFRMSNYGD